MLEKAVQDAVIALPAPERGERGERGPEGAAGAQGDQGERGIQGEKGDAGEAGPAGRDADPIDPAEVARELFASDSLRALVSLEAAEAVAEYFKANPVQHGKDGQRGERGERGEKGDPGRDGLDVKDMFRVKDGRLVGVLSDGTTRDLGEVAGKDGADGKDGRDGQDGKDGVDGKDGSDGLGFDDLVPTYDPEKGLTLAFVRGAAEKEVTIPLVAMAHIGFWREGMSAKTLNTTTHNGCLWIAKRETSATPCHENADDWALAARKGRDGDRGPSGKDYVPPSPIKLDGEHG